MKNPARPLKSNFYLILIIALMSAASQHASGQNGVGINSTGAAANANAMLDVESTSKGVLLSPMTASQANSAFGSSISPAAQGLTVYITSGSAGPFTSAGYWYNTSATTTPAWVLIGTGSGSSGWGLTGNSTSGAIAPTTYGTTTLSGGSWLGTSAATQDLVFGTNNLERMRIGGGQVGTAGNVGIGTASPAFALDVNGDINIGASGSNANGLNIGGSKVFAITSSYTNTLVGEFAGFNSSTATGNTYLGYEAGLLGGSTLNNNTFIGASTAPQNAGSNNTVLGANAVITSTGSAFSNATAIGANAAVNQANSLVLGSINGVNSATANTNVGIGTTTPSGVLDVEGNTVSSGTGSSITMNAGTGPGTGGGFTMNGGDAGSSGGNGGSFSLRSGAGSGSSLGGSFDVFSGSGGTGTGGGGNVVIESGGGGSGSTGGAGGLYILGAGNGGGTAGGGGTMTIFSGGGSGTGSGGALQISSGSGGSTGAGGNISITGGAAGGGTNKNGGSVTITAGTPTGTGSSAISIGNTTLASSVSIGGGIPASGNTQTIGIGNGSSGSVGIIAITIGSTNGVANTTTIQGGNSVGAIALSPNTNGSIIIGASTGVGAITLGSSTGAGQTVNIGSGSSSGTDVVNIGTGSGTKNINIGTTAAGTVTIGNASNNVNLPKLTGSQVVMTDASKNMTSIGLLPIANGGTNSNATATAGGIGYGTGSAHAYSAVGTSGQLLTSGGSGTPTWATVSGTAVSGGTVGGVPWYPTSSTLGTTAAGTTTVAQFLQSNGSSAPSWVDATNPLYSNTYVAHSTGSVSISSATGATAITGASITLTVASATNKIYVYADGGSQTTSASAAGFSVQDIDFFMDGSSSAFSGSSNGGSKRVVEANNTGLTQMITNWTLATVISNVATGSHTFIVGSAGSGAGGSAANVGGVASSVEAVTFIIQVVYQ